MEEGFLSAPKFCMMSRKAWRYLEDLRDPLGFWRSAVWSKVRPKTVVICWNIELKAPVWVGGMKALWRSEICNQEGLTFQDRQGAMGE